MEKNKENFLERGYPCIIVCELTLLVIRETLEAFAADKEDAFWLKLYHLTVEWNIHDLNTILDRNKKRLKDEKEEEED
jgi:predicted kinase